MVATLLVHTPLCIEHKTGKSHPESPQRYLHIIESLRTFNLPEVFVTTACHLKWVLACHSKRYVRLVQRSCEALSENEVAPLPTGDATISSASFTAARTAVNAALCAVDAVMQEFCKNAFVVTRPPGHHATRSHGMGFCIFNTVAIAARYLQTMYGLTKIVIIDWDGHHGNGTASIFRHDPSVLYISTHQRGAYPGTGNKSSDNTINVPVSSEKEILSFFETELPDLIANFNPEFILISCGFDAHKLDPLLSLDLKSEDFGTLTTKICNLAQKHCSGRIISILEGGYHLKALEESALFHVKALQTQVKIVE